MSVKKVKEKQELAKTESFLSAQSENSGFIVALEDIDVPRLNIIQKMSSIEGPIGGIVIDKTDTLVDKDDRCDVVVAHTKKGWRENVPFGTDELPQIAWSEQDRNELQSSTEYGDLVVFADITFLIPQPDGAEDDLYQYPIGDTNYALGVINVAKDGYKFT